MSLSDGLREGRLQRLHAKCLAASEEYPSESHLAIDFDTVIRCSAETPVFQERTCEGNLDRPLSVKADMNRGELYDVTSLAFSLQGMNPPLTRDQLPDFHLLRFDSEYWYGCFHSSEPDEEKIRRGSLLFAQLSDEMAGEFFQQECFRRSQHKWVELLYHPFPGNRHSAKSEVRPASVHLAWLPCNVFLASAKGIELLIDRQDRWESLREIVASHDASADRVQDWINADSQSAMGRAGGGGAGVSLLDAALILTEGHERAARETVHRWQRKRSPKLPPCIGFCPSHSQRKLYALSGLCDFVEEEEGKSLCAENRLRQRLRKRARIPRSK